MAVPGNQHNLRHGHCRPDSITPEYRAWHAMKTRCSNPRVKSFKDYGGRGIRVCDRWLESFENFIDDVGLRPSSRHSLGRKDNDGNYEPNNVRWETPEEQQNNTRANHRVTAFGETKNLSEWARERELDLSTLWRRLVKLKWDPERAVSTPIREKKPKALELVLRAGFVSVSHFLHDANVQPSTFYKFIAGKPVWPKTAEQLARALKISPKKIRTVQPNADRERRADGTYC